jgi:hypothetical protein
MMKVRIVTFLHIGLYTLCFNVAAQITYPASWTDKVNVLVNVDNSVSKTVTGTDYNAGAASENILEAGADGYISFIYTANSANAYMVSLTPLNIQPEFQFSLYSIYILSNGALAIYEQNTLVSGYTTLVSGDVVKIAREAGQIKYYRNSTLLRTISSGYSTSSLRADISVRSGKVPPLMCSFDRKLIAKPTMQYPDYNNANGAIALQVEGGNAPFTYQWSSGEQTSDIVSKSRGTYSVNVTDANGRTFVSAYTLGFPIGWKNLDKTMVNSNNTITRTSTTKALDGNASSLNILPVGENGWIEFTITDPSAAYMIGFTNADVHSTIEYLRYAIYINEPGGIFVYESNTNAGFFGNIVKGDVFRISREGVQIVYYKNGVAFRTITGPADKPLYIADASVYSNTGPLPQVTASFEKQIQFKPVITLPDKNSTSGKINLAIDGTYAPSTIQWSTGESSNIIQDKGKGIYSVSVSDVSGRSASRTYTLGYPVYWTDLQKATLQADGSITKSATNLSYDAGAISANRLLAGEDGAIEMVINRADSKTQFVVGLARYNTSTNYPAIDYGFTLHANGYIYIYENGVTQTQLPFKEGCILKISRDNEVINYYYDGNLIRSIATTPAWELHVDCSLFLGTVPMITSTFNYVPTVYYSIASGNWSNNAVWSTSQGGNAASRYPTFGDIVHVKGHAISINTRTNCKSLEIVANEMQGSVVVDGAGASLVTGEIKMRGDGNANPEQILVVKNSALLKIE